MNAQYSMSQVRGSFIYYSLEHTFPDGFVPTHKGLRGSMQGLYKESYKPHQSLQIIYYIFYGFETLFST